MKKSLLVCLWMMLGLLPCSAYIYGQYPDATVKILHDENHVYFCQHKGVSVLDKKTGSWTSYSHQNGMLPAEMQATIALRSDTLWVGGCTDGWLSAICNGKVESRQYKQIKDGTNSDGTHSEFYGSVNEIAFDAQGRMVLGLGNCVRGVVDWKPLECYAIPSLVTEQFIEGMQFDTEGSLWIACAGLQYQNALTRYTFEDGVDFLLTRLEKPYPFRFDACSCLAIDKDGVLWFNPGNQLVKYDGETFTAYETGINANDMAFDGQERLWMVKTGGLCCLVNGNIIGEYNYERPNPFQFPFFDEWFCLDIDDDIIYVGTAYGALKFENGEIAPFELPDLSTGITPTLASPENSQPATMFTLGGTAVTSSSRMTKGVYIENGRKKIK